MSVMTAPEIWSGQDRMLTVEDMENMPDDEFRYELDDGVLIVSPAPSPLHQLALTRLAVTLDAACPDGLVVLVGVGVNINRFQHRVPDVAVVGVDAFKTAFAETPPELAVEVASPRTRLYDRNRKKDVYEGRGPAGADRVLTAGRQVPGNSPRHRR
jgi:Uma2 family endonuclease